jgi:hypothetical protein
LASRNGSPLLSVEASVAPGPARRFRAHFMPRRGAHSQRRPASSEKRLTTRARRASPAPRVVTKPEEDARSERFLSAAREVPQPAGADRMFREHGVCIHCKTAYSCDSAEARAPKSCFLRAPAGVN